MELISDEFYAQGININPSNVRCYFIDGFETSDRQHGIYCEKEDDEDSGAMLIYVAQRVTINGTETDPEGHIEKFDNVILNKGWNYLISSYNEATKTGTITASSTLPDGFIWVIISRWD